MTDERFQDDELEFDDEFVLEDVELDADEFLDEPEDAELPAAPPLLTPARGPLPPGRGVHHDDRVKPTVASDAAPIEKSSPEDSATEDFPVEERAAFGLADPGLPPEPEVPGFEDVLGFDRDDDESAGLDDAEAAWSVEVEPEQSWQSDAEFVGESLDDDPVAEPAAAADPFGWGRGDASGADLAAPFEGPEQALFDAAGAVGSSESRFDESGHWHGSAASFEEIVGEAELAPQAAAWDTGDDDSDFDVDDLEALDAVEIERLDADDFDAALDEESYDEPESLIDYMESACERQPVFAEEVDGSDFDADEDELGLDPMPSLPLDGFELDEADELAGAAFDAAADGFAAAAIDHGPLDALQPVGDDWDLTLRADGSPMAEAEEELPQDWGDETFVVEDPAEAPAEPTPTAGFGAGRFDQPFASNPTAAMAVPQGEGWESLELGVGAEQDDLEQGGEDSWEVSDEAPEEFDPEAYDEADPIYGEEALAASTTVGVEESWSRREEEADWSELEEQYVDGEQEPELHVIGGPGSQRRGGGRWLAAAAVLLIGLGGAGGTIAWLHPEWLGLESAGPTGVERIAIARPELSLQLARPELEIRVADAPEGGELPATGIPGEGDRDLPVGPEGGASEVVVEQGGTVPGLPVGPTPGDGSTGQPDATAAGTDGEQQVAVAVQPEFAPIEVGESLEMRGPAYVAAAPTIDSLRIGMRAWAQLANEAVFVGTVRRIEASFVTLRMEAGEISLDRDEIVAMVPLSDAEDDPVEIENGFVRLGESGTLFGRILRNSGGEHVILETTDSRVSLPLESIDSVGIRTDAGIVVVDDDDDWLEERARRRLSGDEARQDLRSRGRGDRTGDPSRTRSTLPVLPAVPPAGGR